MDGITAPSAALYQGGAHRWRVDSGLQSGPERNGMVIALFGPRPDLVGRAATIEGRPSEELLESVLHCRATIIDPASTLNLWTIRVTF